ncbi:MAG: VacJ family lipoprotein [Gammaproteobacteria bacterium]
MKWRKIGKTACASIAILGILSGCTGTNPHDPYETFNRHAFHLNKGLDQAVLKPLAKVYQAVTPWPLQKGVTNFYSNLGELPTIGNSLLQGQFKHTVSSTWRFVINSTVGIFGLVDVASSMGLRKYENDFGLTLARMGYTSSNYLVLPLFGPRTVRDVIGMPPDRLIFSAYPYISDVRLRNSLYGLSFVEKRASIMTSERVMRAAAFDEYQFQRDSYLQWRNHKIKQNAPGWSIEQELEEDAWAQQD